MASPSPSGLSSDTHISHRSTYLARLRFLLLHGKPLPPPQDSPGIPASFEGTRAKLPGVVQQVRAPTVPFVETRHSADHPLPVVTPHGPAYDRLATISVSLFLSLADLIE